MLSFIQTLLLFLLFLITFDLSVTKEGQENVVTNLDSVNVKQTLTGRDEGEVDRVRGCQKKLNT